MCNLERKELMSIAISSDDEETLKELAKSMEKWVRVGVAKNKNTPIEILIILIDDENEKVRKTVLERLQNQEKRRCYEL